MDESVYADLLAGLARRMVSELAGHWKVTHFRMLKLLVWCTCDVRRIDLFRLPGTDPQAPTACSQALFLLVVRKERNWETT